MPELPEVETVRRGLSPVLIDRRIVRVVARRADLRFPLPERFAERLAERIVSGIERHGKYLLVNLDDGKTWLVHLGMSGRLRAMKKSEDDWQVHEHVIVEMDDGNSVRFRDPRRFGFMDLISPAERARHSMLCRLGPDPLSDDFDGPFLARQLAGRLAPVKPLLLDQRIVAGMGNIYASESLFRARLSPNRTAKTIAGRAADRLVAAIQDVFEEAIEAGGSSLRDHRLPSGELGYFQHRFAVYGRQEAECPRCRGGTAETRRIRRIVQAGRATYYCARCQRA
jgi:formamidopyrimidine-DNA glycosylase